MTASVDTGIQSFGAYVPRRRMSRAAIAAAHAWALPGLKGQAKGEKSFCGWDEDVITMAVEAGRDCLKGRGAKPSSITLASTTAPYADLQNAVIAAAALSLPSHSSAVDMGGSTRAGLSALARACGDAGGDRLIIASEKRSGKPGSVQEMLFGSGAAALLVGQGDDLLAKFLGSESISVPFVDHFRQSGEKFGYHWEERWIRDEGVAKIVPRAVKALLTKIGRTADQVSWFGLTGAPAGSDKLIAKKLAVNPDGVLPDLAAQVGDTGTAQPLLLLVAALEKAKAGDLIVVVSFAQGCEVIAFEMLKSAPAVAGRKGLSGAIAQRVEETAYLKMLSFDGELKLDWGMRAETDNKTALTQLYRSADQILGFVGGQCSACNAVQFPRQPTCVNCAAVDTQKPFALSDEPAKVTTYTADWLQYSPSPPLYMGLVQFDVGARLLMEMVDVGAAGIDVGTPLEMTFRIKERDRLRSYDRYFWKAVPVAARGN